MQSKKDYNLYVGSTNDLKRRFREHNSSKVRSTKHRVPFDLVYYESYRSEEDARKREHNLKLGGRALAQVRGRIQNSLITN